MGFLEELPKVKRFCLCGNISDGAKLISTTIMVFWSVGLIFGIVTLIAVSVYTFSKGHQISSEAHFTVQDSWFDQQRRMELVVGLAIPLSTIYFEFVFAIMLALGVQRAKPGLIRFWLLKEFIVILFTTPSYVYAVVIMFSFGVPDVGIWGLFIVVFVLIFQGTRVYWWICLTSYYALLLEDKEKTTRFLGLSEGYGFNDPQNSLVVTHYKSNVHQGSSLYPRVYPSTSSQYQMQEISNDKPLPPSPKAY